MWGGTVTLTLANTNYNLETLFSNLSLADRPPQVQGGVRKCQTIDFQADITLGSGIIRLGGANLSDTMVWKSLYASQSWPLYSLGADLITSSDIFVRCSVAGKTLNVFLISR